MRILALETNRETLVKSLIGPNEKLIVAMGYHWFRFSLYAVVGLFMTGVLIALSWILILAGAPVGMVIIVAFVAWIAGVGWQLFKRFIDWQYDLIIVTTGKVVIVDQSSIVRQHIRQMNIENIASVESTTQFWNLFPFGKVCFNLKEGVGEVLCLSYIPESRRIASIVSQVIINFEQEHLLRQ
jgi:hypothetical protein